MGFKLNPLGPDFSATATSGGGGGTPAGSTGEIQFNNAGAFGANNNLFWDNSNLRLGIKNSSPSASFDLYPGTAEPGIIMRATDGYGAAFRQDATSQTGGRSYEMISSTDANGDIGGGNWTIRDQGVAGPNGYRLIIDASGNIKFGASSTSVFWDKTNQRLGVGTISPQYTLHSVTSSAYAFYGQATSGGVFSGWESGDGVIVQLGSQSGGNSKLGTQTNDSFSLATNNINRLTIGGDAKFYFKDASLGAASVGYVWTLQNATTGEGAWAAAGGGGATTSLNNLASTAVNTNILPDFTNSWNLGSTSLSWNRVFANNNFSLQAYTDQTDLATFANFGGTPSDVTATPLASVLYQYHNTPDGGSNMGVVTASNATADANATGTLVFETGNKTAGTGNSGDMLFAIGSSAGGTRGAFTFDGRRIFMANGTNIEPLTDGGIDIGSSTVRISEVNALTYNVYDSNIQLFESGTKIGEISSYTDVSPSGANISTAMFKRSVATPGNALAIYTTSYASGNSSDILIESGNSTSNNSGDIKLQTGTAGGTRGAVVIDALFAKMPLSNGPPGGSPTGGEVYYDTGTNLLMLHNGTTWVAL